MQIYAGKGKKNGKEEGKRRERQEEMERCKKTMTEDGEMWKR